ncbi:hypothetical protein S7335_2954 [Synechococcus sp. PCC 7335]|nr:hypothetical protein S7335_2954 [Synechococcus sp. PCC 7335]
MDYAYALLSHSLSYLWLSKATQTSGCARSRQIASEQIAEMLAELMINQALIQNVLANSKSTYA